MRNYALLLLALLSSCGGRAPLADPAGAFRLAEAPADLADGYPIGTLRKALERNLLAFESTQIPDSYRFGALTLTKEEYRRSLEALRPELESWERFQAFVKANFSFYEVYGEERWGDVFTTGYYEPVVKGSEFPTARFSRPLYRTPKDLLSVDLGAFAERNPKSTALPLLLAEQKSKQPAWRARLAGNKVLPYFTRAEIDGGQVLANQGLELAWLDPVDAFFIEIQGSGLVETPKGRLRLGYAAQNGAGYEPIGKYLTHVIPIEEMSMQRIRAHLSTLSPLERDSILFKNPSYVFFQPLEGEALTYSEAEVTPARTIATDSFLFPKGTLGFFDIELPDFSDASSQVPAGWSRRPRWVFDQDTGGAIRGGGRVDLFMGRGEEAARLGGVMKRRGKLWILAPNESFLSRLRQVP